MKPILAIAALGVLHPVFLPSAFAAGQTVYAFPAGDLSQWTQVTIPGGTSLDRKFFATASNFGNRISWTDPAGSVAGLVVTSADNADSRDGAHNSAVLRSPNFVLKGSNAAAELGTFSPTDINFKLLAGKGAAAGPANFSNIPANSVNNAGDVAYLGVGLRRVSDGAYLLWGRRTSNAQSTSWETVTWNETTLTNAIASDAPGTLYTLDLVDAAHGSWGWLAMDSLTMTDTHSTTNVSVRPLDITGAESGSDHDLSVRFTRTGNLANAVPITFSLTGTAGESVDYQQIPGYGETGYTITLPAGVATVDLPVHIIPNGSPEIDRSLQVNIVPASGYEVATPSTAQLWISDLPATGGLVTVSGPLNTGTYLPIPNPFTTGAQGSLFFYGEANYASSYLVLGVRGVPLDNSSNGGVDIGRNNGSAGAAIFDYLDNKGVGSGTARVAASPEIPISAGGHYTLIGEIEMHADNTGVLRAWIWNGAQGTYDFATPYLVNSFTSGFTGLGEQIYLRLDAGGPANTWTNARAIWVAGADPSAREAAFHSLTPARPFLQVDASVPVGGEFGQTNQVAFNVVRSGLPNGSLEVPLNFFGSATPADFSVEFPTTALFDAGQSSVQCGLPIASDDLYEGNEDIAIGIENTMAWLVPTSYPVATVNDRPFQGWMASMLPGSTQGPEDDFDNDHWSNVLEYFSGTLPSDAASLTSPYPAPGQPSALRFLRSPLATDVDAKVLWSTDLTTWKQSGESNGALTVNITESLVGTSETGVQTIDATAQATGGETNKLFLRLDVQLP
ncbi:hypothetical protein [Luteolibacter soli]|uniref:Calx-beta domain-containing protein n=1 Tax=Luteolibacter soli TaxID=3135280 RepID=A0ABU9AQ95_9BACT